MLRKFLVLFTFLTATVAMAGDHTQDPPQDTLPSPIERCALNEWRCVPHCEYRTNEGECRTYGADYCGYNARCVPFCEYREASGLCRNYGKDVCGSGQNWLSP